MLIFKINKSTKDAKAGFLRDLRVFVVIKYLFINHKDTKGTKKEPQFV